MTMATLRSMLLCATVGSFVQKAFAVRSLDLQALESEDDWQIYKESGPVFKDIAQGELGDCYYLSGIAALAKTHPELIRKAFVTKGVVNSLGRSVYKLRFTVDGEEKLVAIDDSVPMFEKRGYKTKLFFASFGAGEAAWPALLEKGFAKLFGSFFAIVGGWGFQTFKALTQAPVDVVQRVSKQAMWDFIQTAEKNNWPVTGGTQDNDFGTASGHAYVILSTGTKRGKQAVEVYNPWATQNRYTGELRNLTTRRQGDYWMTLDEFSQAFDIMSRARIIPNAHLSSIRIKAGVAQAVQFKTRITKKPSENNPDFYVQLEWPDNKLFPPECTTKKRKMTVSMMVGEKSAGASGIVKAKRPIEYNAVSNLRATMPATAGTYVALVGTFFEDMPGIEEVVVNVYAEEPVTFEKVDVDAAAEALFGLCQRFEWNHQEFVRGQDFKGSPTWDAKGSQKALRIDYRDGPKVYTSRAFSGAYRDFRLADVKCLSDSNGSHTPGGNTPGGYAPGGGHTPGGHTPGGHAPGGYSPGGYTPGGGHSPGGHTPGGYTPGGYTPGGHSPSGYTPGGHTPGGYTPGGHTPGGYTPGGYSPGGHSPGGHSPGGHTPGGHTPGSYTPGGYTPGGHTPGGYTPGGYSPGGHTPGGHSPGGYSPGGYNPGGHTPGGHTPSGYSPGGHSPGGHSPGGYTPGGHSPGGHTPGGYSPGGHTPGGYAPGGGANTPTGSPSAYNGGGGYKPYTPGGYKPHTPGYSPGGGSNTPSGSPSVYNGGGGYKPYTPGGYKPHTPGYSPGGGSNTPSGSPSVYNGGGGYKPYRPYKAGSLAEDDQQAAETVSGSASIEDLRSLTAEEHPTHEESEEDEGPVLLEEDQDEEEEVDKACDQQLVRDRIARYSKLDNYAELAAGQKDRLFPEVLTSIGDPNADCGDAATGQGTSCADLNHWKSITQQYGKPSIVPNAL